jgi:hypothetical protein
VKELGLLIDFYQPLIHEESILKKIISDLHSPVVRLLKIYKELPVSINIPLSTLELWDNFGFKSLTSDIKDLYQNESHDGRIEILGSSPYGMPLVNLPESIIESQIILNEYGLSYYLGSSQGFEGEPSLVLRDVRGFVSPFSLVNNSVIKILSEFGYEWVEVSGDGEECGIFNVEVDNHKISIVRTFNIDDINSITSLDSFKEKKNSPFLVKLSLSGLHKNQDFFKADYRDIVNRVELFLNDLFRFNFVFKSLSTIVESIGNNRDGNKYYGTEEKEKTDSGREVLDNFIVSMCNYISEKFGDYTYVMDKDNLSVNKIWDFRDISRINDQQLRYYLSSMIALNKISYIIYSEYENMREGSGLKIGNNVLNIVKVREVEIEEILSNVEDIEVGGKFKELLRKNS